MEGISKERLQKLLDKLERQIGDEAQLKFRFLDHLIDFECKELDPWLPIETAPRNKPLLVYYPTMEEGLRQRVICRLVNWDASLHKPTHYKELPEDPK